MLLLIHKKKADRYSYVLIYLFVKVPQPGDSEVNFSVFESSCRMLLPV